MKKRKIITIVLAATILILGGLSLWFFGRENKVPRTFPETPSKKIEKQLQKAALNTWGHEFYWTKLNEDGSLNDGGARYYGIYGDCIAVFESTMLCWVETKQVADSEFTHSSSFVIWIYHDGEFCTIEEAWEQGLLTKEQVALMAEYHEKAVEYIWEYYQAQLPE
ncbi:MAG: hypothetical protein J6J44_00500 [Lachnospiraceae bacterium]|nr:hypothetical protein [Lachnospiraceae bacterium]MBP3592984.1 hypothetical protein [Lachnospiraceae bacterium]